jgi:hypothetical protein
LHTAQQKKKNGPGGGPYTDDPTDDRTASQADTYDKCRCAAQTRACRPCSRDPASTTTDEPFAGHTLAAAAAAAAARPCCRWAYWPGRIRRRRAERTASSTSSYIATLGRIRTAYWLVRERRRPVEVKRYGVRAERRRFRFAESTRARNVCASYGKYANHDPMIVYRIISFVIAVAVVP